MKESEKAMKLMQALSGVDEELLERSEERKTGHKIVRFMNRYGKGCAACLCLIVAGAAFFLCVELKRTIQPKALWRWRRGCRQT